MVLPVRDWTVDYGQGPKPIQVPHVWHLDVPLTWEGPAIYRTRASVPAASSRLVFHGVSYEAFVRIEGQLAFHHRGIWDAFEIDLTPWAARDIEIEVAVTKNGGESWPVPKVASGFIPYVYGTFGGLFREVEIVAGATDHPRSQPSRVTIQGRKIFVDDQPFYARGVLTWGWYPDLATPHLPPDRIAKEIEQVRSLDFNLIKFCLWMPPHEYLRQMREDGLMAWLELPLWLPSGDEESLAGFRTEIMRIVDQYAHHANVLAWTIGCELSESTPASFREELVEYVRMRTGSPLVKDNSGGAEMYGGDPREFGDFDDFHPYCDTHFYAPVLDSLLPGPRTEKPILLGEFNDYDVCRDLARVKAESCYWASPDPVLNDQGVRWQYDLPAIMQRFGQDTSLQARLPNLIETSREQSQFIRRHVQEQVRAREEISGYVVTGWADTPISTAGFLDDWGDLRGAAPIWNHDSAVYLIPRRMPPWINGGNRPGWRDPYCHWTKDVLIQLGQHSTHGAERTYLEGAFMDSGQGFEFFGPGPSPLESRQIGEAFFAEVPAGDHALVTRNMEYIFRWPMTFVERPTEPWPVVLDDPRQAFAGLKASGRGPTIGTNPQADGLIILLDEGTLPRPFWREACHEWSAQFWQDSGWPRAWHRLLSIATDRALDPAWLNANLDHYEVVWNRVDMRTLEDLPLVVKGKRDGKPVIATTLRPFGGLGSQPFGVDNSPAGTLLLLHFLKNL